MLIVDNQEHFNKVTSEVLRLDEESDHKFGLLDKYLDILMQIAKFGDHELNGESLNHLRHDFSPLSFIANCCRKDKETGEERNWYTIGVIFHNGAGMEDGTFSVELSPPSGPHWSLHS